MSEFDSNINSEQLKANILIVDDEPANVLLFTKILESKGYENITTTLDPCEVILLQQKHEFALILLDINMPEMNGFEVLQQLKDSDSCKNTQVIATSGNIEMNYVEKALDAGFIDYITKPMRMNEILEKVDNALQ